jgi:hypothetical protein
MAMREPAEIERDAKLPAGPGERFFGYGVMWLPWGADLGAMGPAAEQARLRDFAIPQRGIFVVGRAFFV